jgi:hypothetical protein
MEGATFDIVISIHDPARSKLPHGMLLDGFGSYPRSYLILINLGPKRQWDERFAARPIGVATEIPTGAGLPWRR